MNVSGLNVTSWLPAEASRDYVLIDACRAWCHNTVVKLNYAPVVILALILVYYYVMNLEFSDPKINEFLKKYFVVTLWIGITYLILALIYKQV